VFYFSSSGMRFGAWTRCRFGWVSQTIRAGGGLSGVGVSGGPFIALSLTESYATPLTSVVAPFGYAADAVGFMFDMVLRMRYRPSTSSWAPPSDGERACS